MPSIPGTASEHKLLYLSVNEDVEWIPIIVRLIVK